VLDRLDPVTHPSLMVGSSTLDDAGVYRLDDETALIQTVDFFTPVVDDPWTFGAVSAANSLSDVYAMGGRPLTALAVTGLSPQVSLDTLTQILAGGQAKAQEAGVPVIGGHTVKDPELKYGLAVTGVVHPDRIVTNAGARPGDVLYLTKPLGTGVITTSLKNGAHDEGALERAVEEMLRLNAAAAEAMVAAGASSCTDVTGFGMLGHTHQLAHASGVAVEIDLGAVPLLPGAREAADAGHVPGGLNSNADFLAAWVTVDEVDEAGLRLLYDPQTSGGLLIAVAPDRAMRLAEELQRRGEPVHPVGRVIEGPPGSIRVTV
jgi:selenide,water dikinase